MYIAAIYTAVLFGILSALYYIWYLTWPIVTGIVSDLKEGISDISKIRSPSNYRIITFEYDHNGKRFSSQRQSLFFSAVNGPKINSNQIKVRHCPMYSSLSCPNRPIYDLLMLAVILIGLTIFSFIMLVGYWDGNT